MQEATEKMHEKLAIDVPKNQTGIYSPMAIPRTLHIPLSADASLSPYMQQCLQTESFIMAASSRPRLSVSSRYTGFDFNFRVVLVGNRGVGKSSLIRTYVHGHSKLITTTGKHEDNDCMVKELVRFDKRVRIEIRDTAGLERYRSLTASYYRGAHGCIILFDVTNQKSFDDVTNWYRDLKEYGPDNVQAMLVGSRCHLTNERAISVETALKRAEDLEIPYTEVSSESNTNVEQLFTSLLDSMLKRFRLGERRHNSLCDLLEKDDVEKKKKTFCPSCKT
ncbi:ras-related protein ORAB-1 [Lingula anatina]|uniref:Ras-related protein ORAB-1 n=1 Tax=Lingula anatina TaxID=7574 RepID=A0A1S3JXJ7_LINAN|nr:ras-related protein ORAB-1 [Lingula anatina]|eukprot:XP_013414774.1 ras-related protein ORAB-1 [Lingula anatina]